MASPAAPTAAISTRLLTRGIVLLIAVWSLLEGIVLVGFHGVGSGALGAGVSDAAGQRLLGAHLLVLVPAYLLIALRLDRYQAFIWLPFAAQLVFAIAVAYAIIAGDTDFGDGVLVVAVSAIFAGALGFVWITEQRTVAVSKLDDDSEDAFAEDT
jgi:hypothetical protein